MAAIGTPISRSSLVAPSARTGTCSATAVPEVKRLSKSAPVRIASLTEYARFGETYSFSQVGISCGY